MKEDDVFHFACLRNFQGLELLFLGFTRCFYEMNEQWSPEMRNWKIYYKEQYIWWINLENLRGFSQTNKSILDDVFFKHFVKQTAGNIDAVYYCRAAVWQFQFLKTLVFYIWTLFQTHLAADKSSANAL